MIEILNNSNIAFIGGGRVCNAILKIVLGENFKNHKFDIVGVADINNKAKGMVYAKGKGIFTTQDFKELFKIKDLNLIIELTGEDTVIEEVKAIMPARVRLVDHFEAMSIWDYFQVEEKAIRIKRVWLDYKLNQLRKNIVIPDGIENEFVLFSKELSEIVEERTKHLQEVEKELIKRERILSHIIQGSTIPTFVINNNHIVTHWNTASERLTGYSADEMVGTNKQWLPYYLEERPVLADIIVDGSKERVIERYYCKKWHKSVLIEGAYEAEDFFPSLGESGSWLYITASPIKDPDGKIIGAIETLWDKTHDKKREEDRERHNRELSALCDICTALSTSINLDDRLKETSEMIFKNLPVDIVCIFIRGKDKVYRLRYSYGISEGVSQENTFSERKSIIDRVVDSRELAIFEDITAEDSDKIGIITKEGLKSVVYIPVWAKEGRVFGVIAIGSKNAKTFTPDEKNILELIVNRIGLAIESSMIYERYKKSEEKYRSLFDADPNPIFIIDSKTFKILDVNKRAVDCYGYHKEELLGTSFLELGDERDKELINGLKNLTEGESILFSKKTHYRNGYQQFYVNINVSYVRYNEGYALIASTTDTSESIKKETQLIQASKMTTLGSMAAGMAHEINQPLNVIQVCADIFFKKIKNGDAITNEDLHVVANELSSNVQRAAEIINHMRNFARQSDPVCSKLDINEPIRDVFKVLSQQLRVHQIKVELCLDENLPFIQADHNRLEQVFMNLVINTIDAIDEKGGELGSDNWDRLLKIRSFSENGYVVVTVSDNGIGIPEEFQDKIFEPFFTTKEVGKGTGLGISISYGIVKDYGGTIDVKSEVNEGTIFELRFPLLSYNEASKAELLKTQEV